VSGVEVQWERVPGDPTAVFQAAQRFLAMAGDVEAQRAAFARASGQVVAGLRGARAADVAQATGPVGVRLRTVSEQFALAHDVLQIYGVVLSAAQERLAQLAAQYGELVRLHAAGDGDPQTAAVAQPFEIEAAEVCREWQVARQRAVAGLTGAAEVLVPRAGGKGPDEVYREALGAWRGMVQAGSTTLSWYQAMRAWTDPVLTGMDLRESRGRVELAVRVLKTWQAQGQAELLAIQTAKLHEVCVDMTLWMGKDPESYEVLRTHFTGREAISEAEEGARRAAVVAGESREGFVEAVRLGTPFAKVTGVLSVGSGVYEMVSPSHTGWRGWGDRFAGGFGTTGVVLAAVGGPEIAVPVGAVLIAGSAIWSAGNLAVDNWSEIKSGVSKGAEGVEKGAKDAWGSFVDGGRSAVNRVLWGLS
jgi:hypothetical protein